MSGNNWYYYQQQDGRSYPPPTTPTHPGRTLSAADSVHDAHKLFASYPFASATPSTHVARHLSSLTISANPPSYVQPQHYSTAYHAYQEYANEVQHLSAPQALAPVNDGGYWRDTRNDALRYLGEETGSAYSHHQPATWVQSPAQSSSYQTNAFAHSIFQHTTPSASYPTPPPPGIAPSSSSLAFALVEPKPKARPQPQHQQQSQSPHQSQPQPQSQSQPYSHSQYQFQPQLQSQPQSQPQPQPQLQYQQPQPQVAPQPQPQTQWRSQHYYQPQYQQHTHPVLQPQPRTIYYPEESASFFDDFLSQTSQEIPPSPPQSQSTVTSADDYAFDRSQSHDETMEQDSSDPLSLGPALPYPSFVSAPTTPRKRKSVDAFRTPSPTKRIQAQSQTDLGSSPLTPVPSSSRANTPSRAPSVGVSAATKRKLQPFVELPPVPKSWVTPPSSSKQHGVRGMGSPLKRGNGLLDGDDDDNLGGYGPGQDFSPRPRKISVTDSVRSLGKRGGERDDRVPLDKLITLMEDIFEAEDTLPSEGTTEDLPPEFFSSLTTDFGHPLLHPNLIRKLTKYIGSVARPAHTIRAQRTGGSPRGKGGIAELDTMKVSRILKMLERTVKDGEDLEPFGSVDADPTGVVPSPTKSGSKSTKKWAKKKSGNSGATNGDAMDVDKEDKTAELTDADYDNFRKILEVARNSVIAADACIALLASGRLPKQLYSEELITSCLATIKNQLTKIIYPFVEVSDDLSGGLHPLLRYILTPSSQDAREDRQLLRDMFQAISAVLPRIDTLVRADSVAMSETIIIQAVYIAIGPFFVVEGNPEGKGKKENVVSSTFGNSAMRGLRLEALSLIRSIFALHEDQRSWIIEEILTSLIKLSDSKQKAGQFQLRDGRSIRTVSALLLQLVQTSVHRVRVKTRRLAKARQQAAALRRQDSLPENADTLLDEKDMEEVQLYLSGLESAHKVAGTIVVFLMQRSGKTKTTKSSNEAEYRTIFDNLISDLLVVLFWPEWPAAALLLKVICKSLISSLDDVKTASQSDNNNVAKTMALDHLGVVAARLRTLSLKYKVDASQESVRNSEGLKPLNEILLSANVKALDRLLSIYDDVIQHLCRRSSEDQTCESARELTAVAWGQELANALKNANASIFDPDDDEFDPKVDQRQMKPFGVKIKAALRDLWKDSVTDVFDISSQDDAARVDRLAESLGPIQSLKGVFQPILNKILYSLDAAPVFMRTKALRALGQIVTSDPSVLSFDNVRRAIESHLLDSSPAVRDAAVELIGKYMIDSPEVAAGYYQRIADRIADTGLSVRKRVIKLLKSYYGIIDDLPRRVDMCARFVLRMYDEDDSVKDLAIQTIEELWFQDPPVVPNNKTRLSTSASASYDKEPLLSKVAVIMGVAAKFPDKQSALEDMLHKIMADNEGAGAVALHKRYTEICEALIDGLVDASDLPGFTVVNCVRTIYLFTSAYPATLSGANASTLLPYLKNATTAEEQVTSDYLLKIFRASIPHMPKTAVKFGQELQLALQPMILKPSVAGQTLPETVACICAVIEHLTHDFGRLVGLLSSCNLRIQKSIQRPAEQQLASKDLLALNIHIFISALLAQHCDFDQVRRDFPDLKKAVDSVSEGPIVEHVYVSLLDLYEKYSETSLKNRILQCLGFLFRAQPTLMTVESSAVVMDAIFQSPDEGTRGHLLKIIQEFLVSEATKHSSRERENAKDKASTTEVNMDELVGNTEGFADSGVSSAVVQRYLDHILEAALSTKLPIQNAAVEILSFTVKQGLAHPLQSFPVIVALETSPNTQLGSRANALHHVLHTKHASLLNARYTASARASFDYQKKLSPGFVQGYRMQPGPTALLQRWYSLVREKRASRQDFLKAMVRVLDVQPSLKSSQDDIEYIKYMAENFSAFDYKTQEEVLTVIKHLTSVLSTIGMQLVEVLSPSHLLTQLHSTSQSNPDGPFMGVLNSQLPLMPTSAPLDSHPPEDRLPVMRSSVIVGLLMLLKAFLKTTYGITEDKCSKWVPGKKSAIGDKPAVRRNAKPIDWARLPFATSPLLTTEDLDNQRARFVEIWSEDGLTAEPEEDFF